MGPAARDCTHRRRAKRIMRLYGDCNSPSRSPSVTRLGLCWRRMVAEPDEPELSEIVVARGDPGAPSITEDPDLDRDEVQAARPPVPPTKGRPRRRRFWLLLPLALVIAAVAAYRPLIRHYTLKLARENGVVLTLGEIELGWGRVTLTDIGFELVGVEGLAGRAESVTVSLDGTLPTHLEGDGVTLELTGSPGYFALAVSEWSKSYPRLLGLPARATGIDVVWRPEAGAEPWLRLDDAVVEPIEGTRFAGGSLTANAATV